MKRKLTVHASSIMNSKEYVIHYTVGDDPRYQVEVISADSAEEAEELFQSNHNDEDVSVIWINEQIDSSLIAEIDPSSEFNYIWSDYLEDMVVSGFYVKENNEWKHYTWNEEDCLYYWDEADDDWYDEMPNNAVANIVASTDVTDVIDDEDQKYIVAGPDELSVAGFYKFFADDVSSYIKEQAANLLYSWYVAEGEEYMPTDKSDLLDMCNAASDESSAELILTALGEVKGTDSEIEISSMLDTIDKQTVEQVMQSGEWLAEELETQFGIEDITTVKHLFSSKDAECTCVGIEYEDGACAVSEGIVESRCTYDEMIRCIYNNSKFSE